MPAYKDELRNTWYCQFYYEDWQGVKKKNRREALKPNEMLLNGNENIKCQPKQTWI